MAKYILKYDNQCIEMSKANSSILIYKLPYMLIKNKTHGLNISNRFIVYILFGTNDKGKDIIYVGKSKNGIDNRPAAHEDKNTNWQLCYILTTFKERTFFNDGTIQYIEDKIRQRIDFIDRYINTTKQTTSGTANMFDEEDCDDYLREAYNMLFSIGLDLLYFHSFTNNLYCKELVTSSTVVPSNALITTTGNSYASMLLTSPSDIK